MSGNFAPVKNFAARAPHRSIQCTSACLVNPCATRKMWAFPSLNILPRPFMTLKIMPGTHGSSTGILALANHLLACVLLSSSHSGAEASRRLEDGGAKRVRRTSSLESPPSQAALSSSLILNSTRGTCFLKAAKKSVCFLIDVLGVLVPPWCVRPHSTRAIAAA